MNECWIQKQVRCAHCKPETWPHTNYMIILCDNIVLENRGPQHSFQMWYRYAAPRMLLMCFYFYWKKTIFYKCNIDVQMGVNLVAHPLHTPNWKLQPFCRSGETAFTKLTLLSSIRPSFDPTNSVWYVTITAVLRKILKQMFISRKS